MKARSLDEAVVDLTSRVAYQAFAERCAGQDRGAAAPDEISLGSRRQQLPAHVSADLGTVVVMEGSDKLEYGGCLGVWVS
jgi:hypothetical protein